MDNKVFAVLLIALAVVGPLYAQEEFWYLLDDGTDRVRQFDASSFAEFRQNRPASVFVVHFAGDAASKLHKVTVQMLQSAALTLEKTGVVIGSINLAANQDLARQEGVSKPGSVLVYRNGKKTIFHGFRSAETLISFINKVSSGPVTIIDGKVQKKAFDLVETIKVLGYFTPASPALQTFENVAQKYYPDIPFFAVVDPLVASHLKLVNPGTIQVVRPFDKVRTSLPTNPLLPTTEVEIETFLSTVARPVLRYVTKDNLHAILSADSNEVYVISLVRLSSPEGAQFHGLLRSTAKHCNETSKTSILLVDPDDFPAMNQYWQTTFNIDISIPCLGLVNFTDSKSQWVDLTALNFIAIKSEQEAALRNWLQGVEAGTVTLYPLPLSGRCPDPANCPSAQAQPEATHQQAGKTGGGKNEL